MRIGLVSSNQHEPTIEVLCEINAYYNPSSPASKETVRQHARENLLSPNSPHRLVVAEGKDGRVVGLAALTFAYSIVEPEMDRRTQCQLKELYVCSSERGRGIGRALMAWVAAHAKERGCSRIEWPVKASNAIGIAFYESLGARLVEDRLSYRLAGSELSELACQGNGVREAASLETSSKPGRLG
ncbi:GNAT family N-acetyltransferase [Pelomonas sp. HMWF004]|nr:GNAT family N-acetyltransferase [Pelomonas sp. HMWF004]